MYWPERGEVPRLKRYLNEQKGVPLQSLWTDIPPVNSQSLEDTYFATQKPAALLERIIQASSNHGDENQRHYPPPVEGRRVTRFPHCRPVIQKSHGPVSPLKTDSNRSRARSQVNCPM